MTHLLGMILYLLRRAGGLRPPSVRGLLQSGGDCSPLPNSDAPDWVSEASRWFQFVALVMENPEQVEYP